MKVLLVHNYYQDGGGESVVYELERHALRAAGVTVIEFVRHNDEIRDYTLPSKLTLPLRTVWAWDTQRALRDLLRREQPALAHFTNTLPLISPAAYRTCQQQGVAVVQGLHNYRLGCPAATYMRDGKPCEECPNHGLQRAVAHGCYRGSRAASACVVGMLKLHRTLGSFERDVDAYLAPTTFTRNKLIETAALPADRVFVKANFLDTDPGLVDSLGSYALFAGRLVDYKGILTLLAAAELEGPPVPLKIAGAGPLAVWLQARCASIRGSEILGALPRPEAIARIKQARCLVFPSECYEAQPTVILEAFACGVPVVASRLGAMQEIVRDGVTGLLFNPGDARDLRDKLNWALANREAMQAMGRRGRAEFEAHYSFGVGQAALLRIHRETLLRKRGAAALQT